MFGDRFSSGRMCVCVCVCLVCGAWFVSCAWGMLCVRVSIYPSSILTDSSESSRPNGDKSRTSWSVRSLSLPSTEKRRQGRKEERRGEKVGKRRGYE